MASSSASEFIANPTVVEVVKFPRPIFKIIPKIAKQDDSICEFSKIPKGVAYIHCNVEELDSEEVLKIFKTIIYDENGNVKPEHKVIETLGFVEILDIPEFPKEVVRIVLSRVHGEFIWLDSICKITKEAIRAVTSLPSIGSRLDKTKKVPNNTVMTLIGATYYSRSLRVNDIKDVNV